MSASEFSGLPLVPESVKGTRAFRVDELGRLRGIHYPQVWTPGDNDAVCKADSTNTSLRYVMKHPDKYSPELSQLAKEVLFGYASSGILAQYASYQNVLGSWLEPPRRVDPSKELAEVLKTVPHDMMDCACGFYGYFDGSNDYHNGGFVSAVVEGFGEAVIGTRGFRVMKARILALTIEPDYEIPTARRLAVHRAYAGIPFLNSFDQMVDEFPPSTEHSPSPDTDPDFWTRD